MRSTRPKASPRLAPDRSLKRVVITACVTASKVVVADIGLSRRSVSHGRMTAGFLERVPRRTQEDNKYTAGSVLVVGGSRGKTGAACLAAEASLRAGAGICTLCAPGSLNLVFEQRLLEVMTRPCPDEDGIMTMDAADEILEAAERASAIAIGPGLGRTDGTRALVGYLLDRLDKPIVLDASPPSISVRTPMSHRGRRLYQNEKSRLCRPL